MKKSTFAILFLAFVLSVCVFAQPMGETVETVAELSQETAELYETNSGTCGDNLTWTYEYGTLTIDGFGQMYDFSYNGAPWYLKHSSSIEKVILGPYVESIGTYAFSNCIELSSISVPNSINVINKGAFYGCHYLTSVDIPDSVSYIGESAFSNCTKLEDVKLGNGITNISNGTFYKNLSLKNIKIPDNIDTIGNNAFYECNKLESINLGSNIKSIGSDAFHGCNALTSIDIPDSVISLGDRAFRGCDKLESVSIPASVKNLSTATFEYCRNLNNIEIENGVNSIGISTFYNCSSLISVDLPESVTSIDGLAFYNCDNFERILIPKSVVNIGDSAFNYCEKLTIYCYRNSTAHIYARDNNIPYILLDGEENMPITLQVAQIRSENPEGMRYAAYIETAMEGCEYGYIVTREALLKEVSGDTINYDLFKINQENPGYNETAISGTTDKGLKYVGAVAINDEVNTIYSVTGFEFGDYSLGEGLYFTTVLKDIPEDKYEEKFVGRPYVKTPEGDYLYGDTITRSIYEIAKAIPEGERNEYIWSIIYAVEGNPFDDTYTGVGGLLG